MSKQVEVKVVVEVRDPKQADVRVEVKRPELPAPEPEECGYGHGV
jgi:hypothetical protein